MDNMSVNMEKENQKQEDSDTSLSNLVLNVPGCKQWSIVKGSKQQRKLILNFDQIKGFETWIQGLFLNTSRSTIPKHLISADEMYLKLCLEAIHVSALKSSPCGISINNNPIYIQYLHGSHGSSEVLSSFEMDKFVVGSVTESNSMMNILKSPLFQRLAPLSTPISDKKGFIPSSITRTTGSDCSPCQYKKIETDSFGIRSDAIQNSPVSLFNDQSSSSSSTCSFQAMLQCTWKDNLPCFEFSMDDQKEIYIAKAFKTESLDYVYSFHWKDDTIGKMKVSTSLSLCSNNSKLAETEFVLFGLEEGEGGDFQINSRIGKRRRRLSRVMEVLKPSHTVKRRSPIFEVEEREGNLFAEVELAAVVVKGHIKEESHGEEEEVGGWGLKFLKKAGLSCEECSTSVDVILPAGVHGRGAMGNGGPSSIVERWKSGGRCDCGGWDVGCPLTILKRIPRTEDCKSFDIFEEGSEQGIPVVKMTNVHEGLYYVTFRAGLPVLQCFSIAVAMVHSHSPKLRPNYVQI